MEPGAAAQSGSNLFTGGRRMSEKLTTQDHYLGPQLMDGVGNARSQMRGCFLHNSGHNRVSFGQSIANHSDVDRLRISMEAIG